MLLNLRCRCRAGLRAPAGVVSTVGSVDHALLDPDDDAVIAAVPLVVEFGVGVAMGIAIADEDEDDA